jgi:hypothetical protein
MNKWLEILFGLVLLNLSIYLAVSSSAWGEFWSFGSAAWTFLKGGFLWALFFAGILFVILGISDLKE